MSRFHDKVDLMLSLIAPRLNNSLHFLRRVLWLPVSLTLTVGAHEERRARFYLILLLHFLSTTAALCLLKSKLKPWP